MQLAVDVGLAPLCKFCGQVVLLQNQVRFERLFVESVEVAQIGGPAGIFGQLLPLLAHQAAELLDAEFGDQELDPGPGPVALLSQAGEDPSDCLGGGQEFLFGQEFVVELGLVRHGAQTAAHVEGKAALLLPIHFAHDGQAAHVVHAGQSAGFVFTAGKGDLEFAPEVLAVRMTEEEMGQGVGVGGDVECLGAADAGQGAGGQVAHRVAARLAGGDAHGRQAAHQVGRIVDVDIVVLDVLAGGDVQNFIGVLFGQVGQRFHLLDVQTAEGNLDAQHARSVPEGVGALGLFLGKIQRLHLRPVEPLAVVVALTVGAPAQASFGEELLVHLALPAQVHLGFEGVDLPAEIFRNAIGQAFLPTRGMVHFSTHLKLV